MKFTTPAEARAARPALDSSASMKTSEYGGLVAETAFPELEYIECQLANEQGQVCRQRHGKGFVARRKDDVEVYIGGSCARRHFGADDEGMQFASDAELLLRRNRVDALHARITERQADAEFAAKLRANWTRCRELNEKIGAERKRIPIRVLGRLMELVKSGQRSAPGRVQYIETWTDEKGQEHSSTTWQPTSLGTINSPEGLDLAEVDAIDSILRAADIELKRARPQLERELVECIKSLDAALTCEARLEVAEKALLEFRRPENLRAVSWLALRSSDQESIVAYALAIDGRSSKPAFVKALIAEWTREIQRAHGDRHFEPVD